MRTVLNINQNWAFSKEAASVPAALPADWETVNLPHSWNAVDGQDGGGDYFRGTAYYVKEILASDLPEADQYYIELRGANSSADLYVNGEKKIHHDGGYSTWRCDITGEIKKGEKSLIAVAVDNSPNNTVYPQVADFTFYGGIYRDVNLVCVNESHFDLDYYGGTGLKITPIMEGENARVLVETYITGLKEGQTLRYTICNQDGKELVSHVTGADKVRFLMKNVHLWNGRKDPYLYTVEVNLVQDKEILDNVSARFGCRSFKIDPDNGFILNGEEYPLRGVSRHQDRLGYGNAITREHHREDMDLICEMGATTIRSAHYQHDQYFYDLCDKYGMVVWAEIPYISEHMPAGRENTGRRILYR